MSQTSGKTPGKTGIEGMMNIFRENRSASYGKFYFTG
jgi:hypothetical protein